MVVGVQGGSVTVNVQGAPGKLDAWIDFDSDGVWDATDQIFASQDVVVGNNVLIFDVPTFAIAGTTSITVARFRLSTSGGLGVTGKAVDGEVEDHLVTIVNPDADFGDAPLPYPTTLAENGARHGASGPTLGASRDFEADGIHSLSGAADTDGSDEDGVTLSTMQVGSLGNSLTVNVQGGPGKLEAWIDFNGDGSWGGPGEQIIASRDVVVGDNVFPFDVPSYAIAGTTYARFRLSTAGHAGVGGAAADGEVEDYVVTITDPTFSAGVFDVQRTISTTAGNPRSVYAADINGDGYMDVLSAAYGGGSSGMIAWHQGDGSGGFTEYTISTSLAARGATSVLAADVDGDGDLDVLSAAYSYDRITWYENDGLENFSEHFISTSADGAQSVFAADVDGDGDLDVLSASANDDTIAWYENDGSENFSEHTISTTADYASSVYAADVDGDGDLDVFSASASDGTIAWYENNGSQTFTEH